MDYDNMELQVRSEVLPESYCITKHLLHQGPVPIKILSLEMDLSSLITMVTSLFHA